MDSLKQSDVVGRITPTLRDRHAGQRKRKGKDPKAANREKKQTQYDRDDGHQIDEFA